jgi:arsenate reductase-like glutaredoxin family protein
MKIQILGNQSASTPRRPSAISGSGHPFQRIDLPKYGMSRGEFESVRKAVGGVEAMIDQNAKDAALIRYLAYESDKEEKLLNQPSLMKAPVVRNGKQATIGYMPEVWKTWE